MNIYIIFFYRITKALILGTIIKKNKNKKYHITKALILGTIIKKK